MTTITYEELLRRVSHKDFPNLLSWIEECGSLEAMFCSPHPQRGNYLVLCVMEVMQSKWPGDYGTRWPEAEEIIMQDPYCAYVYAANILGSRWPEAEEVIRKDPDSFRLYSYVFKGVEDEE
jgi:hypothetical protein